MLLWLNFVWEFLICSMHGKRPGEGGRVHSKAGKMDVKCIKKRKPSIQKKSQLCTKKDPVGLFCAPNNVTTTADALFTGGSHSCAEMCVLEMIVGSG